LVRQDTLILAWLNLRILFLRFMPPHPSPLPGGEREEVRVALHLT
jgi:hypothetical protein